MPWYLRISTKFTLIIFMNNNDKLEQKTAIVSALAAVEQTQINCKLVPKITDCKLILKVCNCLSLVPIALL